MYYDILSGPPLSTEEEIQLKSHLEYVLAQAQIAVKALGLEPVELTHVMKSRMDDTGPSFVKSWRVDAGPIYS